MQTQLVGPASGIRGRAEAGATDCYVAFGQIGTLDLSCGCYTTIEVFHIAARDLVDRGLEAEVRALLSAGRQTVRDFIQRAYGCALGPREYFTPSNLTGAGADAKDFLRILGRVAGARKRAA
jgi:hypothetical protein